MAINAVIVGKQSGDADLTTTSGTTTTGSTFVVGLSYISSSTVTAVTDSKSNTYTLVDTEISGGQAKSLWYCENGTGGASHTASVDFSGDSFGTIYLVEVTGAATASFDQKAKTTDAATPYTVTTPTLSQADEVVITIIGNEQGGTVDYSSSNTTILSEEQDGNSYFTSAISKQVVAATTAFSPSFTETVDGTSSLVSATFKASAASSTYTITAEQGLYSVSGSEAYRDIVMAADQGTYALTGQDIDFNPGFTLIAEHGLYTLTGSAGLVDLSMSAVGGTYTLTGQDVDLDKTFKLTADAGTYTLTGQAATLTWSNTPDMEYVGPFAADGSLNVVLDDTGGLGIFHTTGAFRFNTTDPGPGIYADDGSYRAVVDSAGIGLYDASGAYRLTTEYPSLHGLHAPNGAYRITVIVP